MMMLPYLLTVMWNVNEAMEAEEEREREEERQRQEEEFYALHERQECIDALWEEFEDDYIAWGEPGHEESYEEFLVDIEHLLD